MLVLVINSGSSSVKFQLMDTEKRTYIVKGIVERIGEEQPMFSYVEPGEEKIQKPVEAKDHSGALRIILSLLEEKGLKVDAVGHRVVHGGEKFKESVLITEDVKKAIRDNFQLAPLHNPPNLLGIEACEEVLKGVPQVAVFDTAFHSTLPPEAFLYAIPYEYYEKYKIRKYGFHGTSHKYVAKRTAELLGKKLEEINIITCHLGNGASITAIEKGKSIDTSMGLTPLEGLIMGTRSGDIDPAIVFFLHRELGLSVDEIDNILNKKSGLLGISGITNDVRSLRQKWLEEGNERAGLALKMFARRVRKYIGAYSFLLGTVDAIVFTAGIGENEWKIREMILDGLENFGIKICKKRNQEMVGGKEGFISSKDSKINVLVVPTNEELEIALETERVIKSLQ